MPVPMKACDGSFSAETEKLLIANLNRAQWLLHACARCGQQVGAHLEKGRWSPDMHWPSVPRRAVARPAAVEAQSVRKEPPLKKP
jgi:hypothetical protein